MIIDYKAINHFILVFSPCVLKVYPCVQFWHPNNEITSRVKHRFVFAWTRHGELCYLANNLKSGSECVNKIEFILLALGNVLMPLKPIPSLSIAVQTEHSAFLS